MKEDKSRRIDPQKEIFYYDYSNDGEIGNGRGLMYSVDSFAYVDSNNFLHNLYGRACNFFDNEYWIDGKQYSKKEWFIKKEEILLQIHREEILNQL